MENLFKVLILTALVVAPWTQSLAETPSLSSAVETEIEERILDRAEVRADSEKTQIRLSDKRVFEIDTQPDREAMKEALGLNLPEKIKQQIIARGGVIEDVNPLQAYETLTAEQKTHFQEVRMQFLTNAARILSSTRFVLGAGTLVGDGFSFVKIKVKQAFGKEVPQAEKVRRTFSERSHYAVQAALRGIDYKLWAQAPMVIDSNEFSLSASLGIVAETGVMKKGGGGSEEIGLSLGMNKAKKAFVFEIFHNSEKFDNTKAAISVLGVVAKAGMTMGSRQGAETLKGSSFYPPAVPGYSSASAEFFSAGFSSSLGLPPPPLADLMTFTNKFERHVWLRVTVSPVVKGFVRIQFGDIKGSVTLVAMRFVDVYKAISDKVFSTGRRSCGVVFN